MKSSYLLINALTLNISGTKYNAVALPVLLNEIRNNASYFAFEFEKLYNNGFTIFKICREGDEEIVQGFVAFRYSPGILDCANMETNNINKSGISLYSGVGKAIVALCCKVSFDMGLDGYITFEAKNRLVPYYTRLGAVITHRNRMAIATPEAQKLVNLYF